MFRKIIVEHTLIWLILTYCWPLKGLHKEMLNLFCCPTSSTNSINLKPTLLEDSILLRIHVCRIIFARVKCAFQVSFACRRRQPAMTICHLRSSNIPESHWSNHNHIRGCSRFVSPLIYFSCIEQNFSRCSLKQCMKMYCVSPSNVQSVQHKTVTG